MSSTCSPFQSWFGSSKAVDDRGNPLELFHGTSDYFSEFRFGEFGFHFGNREQAQSRGSLVMDVYLRLENPLIFDVDFSTWYDDALAPYLVEKGILTEEEAYAGDLQGLLMEKGYDGYTYPNGYEGGGLSYAVFSPEQIKSVHNHGSYDRQSADIFDGPPIYPLASSRGWNLIRGQSWDELNPHETALADLFVKMFPSAVQAAEDFLPLPEGIKAYVILGSEQECLDWEMDEEALGFHAVCARKVDDETGEDYLDVNACNQAVLNLSSLAVATNNDRGDAAAIEAALVTMPHEMAHVTAWLKSSGGRTPLQVFDEDGGEDAIRQMHAHVEASASDRGAFSGSLGYKEDEAEEFGRDVVDRWAQSAGRLDIQETENAFQCHVQQTRPGL